MLIVLPTDFSEQSRKAFHIAGKIAKATGGRIVVVHVIEPITYPVEWIEGISSFEVIHEKIKESARTALQEIAEELRRQWNVEVEVRLLYGYPADAIIEYAQEAGADLICVASRGRSGIEKLLLGSTTDRIVHHAFCPVLVVPAGRSKSK